MNIKIDGFKQAIEMLQALDSESQKSLLEEIHLKDPAMADRLRAHLVDFNDLQYLTVSMFRRLLQDISLTDLGLALRAAHQHTVQKLLSMCSQNMKSDIEEFLLGKPRPLHEVLEAQKKVIQVVLSLRDSGEIILSKEKSEKFV